MRIKSLLTLILLLAGCEGTTPDSQSQAAPNNGGSQMQSLIQQLKDSHALVSDDADAKLDAILSELIPLFLAADPDTRSQIRHAVAGIGTLNDSIRNYAARAAISLHREPSDDVYANVVARGDVPVPASDNDELFRLGVGALAIEDCADYRESLTVLAELCIRGEQAGVRPRRHLEQLASVFSNKLIGGFGNEERPFNMVVRDFRKPK